MTDFEDNGIVEITSRPPQDFFDAREQAFSVANWECTVKRDGCLGIPHYAHQKKLVIGDAMSGYERKMPDVLQSADNLVVCCQLCHLWIHKNEEEATALGYLDR